MNQLRKKILIVDDDSSLAQAVASHLEEQGYDTTIALDGSVGLAVALQQQFDLVLLDLSLPEVDGFDVCAALHAQKPEQAIIIISARTEEIDTIVGLDSGADDFIKKPFRVAELSARIRAVLRRRVKRSRPELRERLTYNGLTIDFERRRVTKHGKDIALTAREFELVSILSSKPGYPFETGDLTEQLYGPVAAGYDKSVSNFVGRIRAKLETEPTSPEYIITVRGVGYKFAH